MTRLCGSRAAGQAGGTATVSSFPGTLFPPPCPLLRDLKEVNYLFSTIPGVRVVIIAGNHDRIRSNSALMSFTWCPNVTFLMSEELSSVYFKDLNLEAHGFSYHTAEINEARLNGIKAPDDGRIHVLLAHGGDAPISRWIRGTWPTPVFLCGTGTHSQAGAGTGFFLRLSWFLRAA